MEVIVGKTAGFCFGVKNAVESTKSELEENKDLYCLGELVHNKQVVEGLENIGLKTIEDISQLSNGDQVIIRAHGVPPSVYEYAKEHNIKITDLTCPKVEQIHQLAKQYVDNDYYIILLGKKTHPEIIGTKGFCGQDVYVVEEISDISDAVSSYENSSKNKIALLVQTTFSVAKFEEISKELQEQFSDIVINKTICNTTEKRQKETVEMSRNLSTMLIIGGKNSSNTKELVKIAQENCKNVYAIETVEELNQIDFSNIHKIGIMAGASTPIFIIERIKRELETKSYSLKINKYLKFK